MATLVTDYGTFDLPSYWDGTNGLDFREIDTVNGVSIERFYAPGYALALQAESRSSTGGAIGFALPFTWDDGTSDADPGAGKIRGNNATATSITEFYVNDADANESDRAAIFALWDDSSSYTKGQVSLINRSDPTAWIIANVLTSVDASGYYKFTVTDIVASGATPFTDDTSLVLGFVRNGDAGDPGDSIVFTYSTNTGGGDPGAGKIAFDTTTLADATRAYIDILDAEGVNISAEFAALATVTSANKGNLTIRSRADPTVYARYKITIISDQTNHYDFSISYLSGSGSLSNNDEIFLVAIRTGDAGDAGTSYDYSFSTSTTGTDPGAGLVALNNMTPASATQIELDILDAQGVNVSADLLTLASVTSTTKARMVLRSKATPAVFHRYLVTEVTNNTTHITMTISHTSGSGTLSDTEQVYVSFGVSGDKGTTGSALDIPDQPAGTALELVDYLLYYSDANEQTEKITVLNARAYLGAFTSGKAAFFAAR